jgi:alkylation response protein AidB-like acyl-CoA dehydrogenase
VALDSDTATEFRRVVRDSMNAILARPGTRPELAASGYSDSAWATARDGGWLEVLVPESAGGAGLGLQDYAPILSEAGAHLFGGPLIENGAALRAISTHAPDRVDLLHQFAHAPLAIVDSAATGDRLLVSDDGVLTAELPAVRFATSARWLLVAYVRRGNGPEVAVVDARSSAAEASLRPSFDPYSGYAALRFDALRPAASEIVLSGAQAQALVADLRAAARLLASCELSGLAARALDMSVEYAHQRRQFGRTIGSFQAIQQILADMTVRTLSLQAMCQAALKRADGARGAFCRVANVAKAYAAVAAREVVEAALQVHGGIAFTREFGLGSYYTHALALQGYYGDHHQHMSELGEQLISGEVVVA